MMNHARLRTASERSGKIGICFSLVSLFPLLVLLLARTSYAGAEASAVYTQAQGTILAVEIHVGAPPPAS